LADDASAAIWVFIGIFIGLPLGVTIGWLASQAISPRPSTVVVERTEHGYVIHES
jgi:cell division septal protein FtsQ